MILKTAANYNDEGGYIEAWKNSDGTTEVKLIPKSGGGDEGKNGILSVTISPAITTTPALDSLFPIYWEDLTDEEKEQKGKTIMLTTDTTLVDDTTYTVTVTPTADWYAIVTDDYAGKGEPVTFTATASAGRPLMVSAAATSATDPDVDEQFHVMLMINGQG